MEWTNGQSEKIFSSNNKEKKRENIQKFKENHKTKRFMSFEE